MTQAPVARSRRAEPTPTPLRDLPAGFGERVVQWQRQHGRHHLPWQVRDPYRVWLSEVMLQQTQVSTVLVYYARFIARFPDLQSLADTDLDAVLALWSGLGYYGRARNLHRCARLLVAHHGAAFPRSSAELAKLPGIGRSTAAAIAAICFDERVAILDGNVKRVLARVLAFDADLSEPAALRDLWDAANRLLPESSMPIYTQGLMDIGATVCTARSPRCLLCPLNGICKAAAAGKPERYPVKSRRATRSRRDTVWLDLRRGDRVWLVKRPSSGVWAELWSLPEFDSLDAFALASADWPGAGDAETPFVHVLTHLDWTLRPVIWRLPARLSKQALGQVVERWPEGSWFDVETSSSLGLPAPLRKRLAAG